MNVNYNDGTSYSGPYDEDKLREAMADERFASASIYKVGQIVQMSDRRYRVGEHGNLIRIEE